MPAPAPVLLIATTNPGKLREFAALLGPAAGVSSMDRSRWSLGAAKSDRLLGACRTWKVVATQHVRRRPPECGRGAVPPNRRRPQVLDGMPLTLRSLIDLPGAPAVAEDGSTYLENARAKALAIARWSGQAALGDDSGLEVDALGGAPGIHSARYAGAAQDSRANVAKLLQALAGVPEPQRTARFRCVLVVARPDGRTLVAEGSCEGRITGRPSGSAGFGYDPVFFFPPAGMTFAELPRGDQERGEPSRPRLRAAARAVDGLRGVLSQLSDQPSAHRRSDDRRSARCLICGGLCYHTRRLRVAAFPAGLREAARQRRN